MNLTYKELKKYGLPAAYEYNVMIANTLQILSNKHEKLEEP